MQKKHGLILLAVGLPLLGMVGCTGLLVVAGAVAASQSDGEGQRKHAMANDAQPIGPTEFGGDSIEREAGEGEAAPQARGAMPFGAVYRGIPIGDSPNYVPSYDPMKSKAGTEEFGQMIRDESSIQDNQTGEISHNVDNSVANPMLESGEATVVSPTATTESAPLGE